MSSHICHSLVVPSKNTWLHKNSRLAGWKTSTWETMLWGWGAIPQDVVVCAWNISTRRFYLLQEPEGGGAYSPLTITSSEYFHLVPTTQSNVASCPCNLDIGGFRCPRKLCFYQETHHYSNGFWGCPLASLKFSCLWVNRQRKRVTLLARVIDPNYHEESGLLLRNGSMKNYVCDRAPPGHQ